MFSHHLRWRSPGSVVRERWQRRGGSAVCRIVPANGTTTAAAATATSRTARTAVAVAIAIATTASIAATARIVVVAAAAVAAVASGAAQQQQRREEKVRIPDGDDQQHAEQLAKLGEHRDRRRHWVRIPAAGIPRGRMSSGWRQDYKESAGQGILLWRIWKGVLSVALLRGGG